MHIPAQIRHGNYVNVFSAKCEVLPGVSFNSSSMMMNCLYSWGAYKDGHRVRVDYPHRKKYLRDLLSIYEDRLDQFSLTLNVYSNCCHVEAEEIERGLNEISNARKTVRSRISLLRHPDFLYRSGSVPFTGRRRGFSVFRRKFKTASEKRASVFSYADWDEGYEEPKFRARRSKASLPDPWDDILRHNERNWKRHRRTQWK